MRSTKIMTLKLLSLAAVLMGAASLVGCGGGAALPGGSTLLLDPPVLTPPPGGGNLPDPIPMPPGGGQGSPVDPVDPAPMDPPADPPTEPAPHEDPPTPEPVLAPDLAHVRAMAIVTENAMVAEDAESYIGLYVADEDGGIWRRVESGSWNKVGTIGVLGTIEAMTYVRTRHALYLAIDTLVHGPVLARWLLTPTPEVFDFTVDPPAQVDAGGEQFQIVEDSAGRTLFNVSQVTGLAFDTAAGVLYAWDHDNRSLLSIADLDVAEATFERQFTTGSGLFDDVQDLAYDRENARMLLVDAAAAAVIELDHLGLASLQVVTLPYADVRAIAWEEVGTRLAVDRDSAALIRFDRDGAVLE
jgi:hypothetical protein